MARCAAILLILLWAPWAMASGLHGQASPEPRAAAHCAGGAGQAPEAPPLAGDERDDACLLHCTTAAQAAPATAATPVSPPVTPGVARTPDAASIRSATAHASASRPEPLPPRPLTTVVLRL